jgi:hypothetical protein
MVTVTVNVSEEHFDKLALQAAYEDISVGEFLTRQLNLQYEADKLLNKLVSISTKL